MLFLFLLLVEIYKSKMYNIQHVEINAQIWRGN